MISCKYFLNYILIFIYLEMARSKASRIRHHTNRSKGRVEVARENSCVAYKNKFNQTPRKIKTLFYCTREKCICISCFAEINGEERLKNRCGCNNFFGYEDYDAEYRLKFFCALCHLPFNYMTALGVQCYSLITSGSCVYTMNERGVHCSVKKIEYTGCDHLTCNSCAHQWSQKNLNHYVCGVCFPDLDEWSPPPGGGYRGQVVALKPANSITSIFSDSSISSDSD